MHALTGKVKNQPAPKLKHKPSMDVRVKQEIFQPSLPPRKTGGVPQPLELIELSSSSSSSESESETDSESETKNESNDGVLGRKKRRKLNEVGVVLPVGFLSPISNSQTETGSQAVVVREWKSEGGVSLNDRSCKQFWKAGDYEGSSHSDWDVSSGGMDHVRVHPKFLHSNATSHKWALGAFAELLDNALDEVCNGATYVNIDMLVNRKDGSRMLLIEDNGGGMNPDKMRQCMSLGYSVKSKMANTIGQYGNGFKTSTMRLGADVIVFSRCVEEDGRSPTQSIGLLSYTFLRSTGKEDIVVPMLDYQKDGCSWNKIIRSSPTDWNKNVETIVEWAPFSSEAELIRQFNELSDHGTRIIIYNLWEDDQGLLEVDFDTDPHDIQLRGVNRDEKNIQMAKQFPNSRHFLTYRHSLRSYASILYLRIPPCFRIILRGKDVEHHNIVNDMMMSQEITYRPQIVGNFIPKDSYMAAIVTIGFVKDAKHHIDVQGFNVYHKNRLIKPFWRLWNAAGSDGRGVIGVLEANFVEPAHDKQGFERTTVLSRLEAKLIQMQKNYWCSLCHKIGYAPRRNKKQFNATDEAFEESSPDPPKRKNTDSSDKASPLYSDKYNLRSNGNTPTKGNNGSKSPGKFGKSSKFSEPPTLPAENGSDDDLFVHPVRESSGKVQKTAAKKNGLHANHDYGSGVASRSTRQSLPKVVDVDEQSFSEIIDQLKQENRELKRRLENRESDIQDKERNDLQCEKCQSLESQLEESRKKIDELGKEQDSLVDIFSEERDRRDIEEKALRKRLEDACNTIQELRDKIQLLEKKPPKFRGSQ